MNAQNPAVTPCVVSEEMIAKLMEAMGESIRATMTDAFSFSIEVKPWTLTQRQTTEPVDSPQSKIDIIGATRHRYGVFVLRFDRQVIEKIIQRYAEGRADQTVFDDAVCEIANMIYGLFKAAVNKMGCHLTMQLPAPYHEHPDAGGVTAAKEVILPFVVDGLYGEAVLIRAA